MSESVAEGDECRGERANAARHLESSENAAVSMNGPSVPDIVQPFADPPPRDRTERVLGDFTTTRAILPLVPLAIVIGVLGAGISLALLDMIGFFTNLFYFQRLSVHLVSPYGNTLGAIAVIIPIGGGLVVGLMARFGSEQIRGHGIPEAMERILINGSKVQPRLAILKPISSAISIGTGGPFGAEGPIILTGGAVGSVVGQLFHLTAAQRKSLLVAGAAAGMSAVFGTPVAATLFGVELLAFEFKPRSMVLIGIAAATADGLRMVMASAGLVAPQPIFPVPSHAAPRRSGSARSVGRRHRLRLRCVADDTGGLSVRGSVQEVDWPSGLDVVAHDRRASSSVSVVLSIPGRSASGTTPSTPSFSASSA